MRLDKGLIRPRGTVTIIAAQTRQMDQANIWGGNMGMTRNGKLCNGNASKVLIVL